MLVVMNADVTQDEIQQVMDAILSMGFTPKPVPGVQRTTICVLGNETRVDDTKIVPLHGVREVIHVSKPYKLVSREGGKEQIVVKAGKAAFGGVRIPIIAGPCAVEGRDTFIEIAEILKEAGVDVLRGGAYKPRTSPYSFQGLGEEGLKILALAREKTGLPVCTEVMDTADMEIISEYSDIVQIGARNMHNFSLLKKAGRQQRPVLLKRGFAATINELLLAAEYIMNEGNENIILCERGIRTYEEQTRNTLDLSAIPIIQTLSRLPIIVDPSHACGRRAYIQPMARAAIAAGADGLIVEVHQDPAQAFSDGPQSLTPGEFSTLMKDIGVIASAIGKHV